jgi:hypothetical protein
MAGEKNQNGGQKSKWRQVNYFVNSNSTETSSNGTEFQFLHVEKQKKRKSRFNLKKIYDNTMFRCSKKLNYANQNKNQPTS